MSLPPRRTFFKNFGLFLAPVSGYKKMYFLVDTPQTVDITSIEQNVLRIFAYLPFSFNQKFSYFN